MRPYLSVTILELTIFERDHIWTWFSLSCDIFWFYGEFSVLFTKFCDPQIFFGTPRFLFEFSKKSGIFSIFFYPKFCFDFFFQKICNFLKFFWYPQIFFLSNFEKICIFLNEICELFKWKVKVFFFNLTFYCREERCTSKSAHGQRSTIIVWNIIWTQPYFDSIEAQPDHL